MGKALNTIVAAVAAVAVFAVTGNVSASLAAFTLVQGVLSVVNPGRAPRPENASTSQKQPIPPRTFAYGRSRLHGYSALFDTASNGTSVDVYAFADGQADAIETVYLNDEKVTVTGNTVNTLANEKYGGGNVKVGWTLGPVVNTAFSYIIGLLPGKWTANHRGDGVVTGYLAKQAVKEKYFLQNYPQGDSVSMSLVGRWQLCFDPRDGITRWTENPVLQLLHYITVRRGYDYDTRIAPTVQFWKDAANVCEEAIPLKSGGAEPRYRSCVTYSATAQPKEVIGSFLETFDGWIAPRGDGAIVIYAGKLYTPTVTIGPDDIIGYRFQNQVEDENSVDQLTVSYVSEAHDWNVVETTPWGGENGAFRVDSLSPQSPSFSQNRRLAKRKYAQINAANRGSCTTNIGGRRARGQRYIYLDLREDGFDPFEGILPIVEIQALTRDFTQGGMSFDWVRVDLNLDSWNPATEEGEAAATGDRVEQQPLEAPTIVSIVKEYGQNSTYNTPGVKLTITAAGPADRNDLTWYVRTKPHESSIWLEQQFPDIDPGPSVLLQTDFLPLGILDVQVSYGVGDGRVSPWGYLGAPTNTANVLPDAVTGLSVTQNMDGTLIVADWNDANFATRYLVEIIPSDG